MLKEVKPKFLSFRERPITVHGYSVVEGVAVADYVATSDEGGRLPLCYGTVDAGSLIFHSAAIDTLEKADDFYRVVNLLMARMGDSLSRRLVAVQLANFDREGVLVSREHCELMLKDLRFGEGFQIAHHPVVTDGLFVEDTAARLTGVSMHEFHYIERLAAVEALSCYSGWVAEELESVVKTFATQEVQLYELEADLMDFIHEARSPITQATKSKIQKLLVEKGAKTHQEKIESEKELLKLRMELQQELGKLVPHIKGVGTALDHLGSKHPELWTIRPTLWLLEELLNEGCSDPADQPSMSWGRKMLILNFIWKDLGAMVAFNSSEGGARSNIAFAATLAASRMMNQVPRHQIIEVFCHWDQVACDLNRAHMEERKGPFHDYRLDIALQLRQDILSLLVAFSVSVDRPSSGEKLNRDYLNLLHPVSAEGKVLIDYDDEGNPSGLTEEGRELLIRCLG